MENVWIELIAYEEARLLQIKETLIDKIDQFLADSSNEFFSSLQTLNGSKAAELRNGIVNFVREYEASIS